jgi:capsular polysaccharide biosynthesis protein
VTPEPDEGAAPPADEAPAPAEQGPTFRGPLESAMRHKRLALVPILLLVAAGAAIGLLREPEYESEARVSVGRVDAPAYTLDDLLIANVSLARTYSRVVEAEGVVRPAARAAGVDFEDAADGLSGSPVPGSSLISIEAQGSSSDETIALANAAAGRLIVYVETLNERRSTNSLFAEFRRSSRRFVEARDRLVRLQRDDASRAAIRAAQIQVYVEQGRLEASRFQYRNNKGLPTGGLLQLAVPAVEAESDRSSVLQRLLLIGLGAGLVLGLGLALLRENRALITRHRA